MVPASSATVGAMLRMTTADRRARLGTRHHLAAAAPASDLVPVAGDLVGLHATDPASVHLAAAARCPSVDVAGIERALYEERSLVRMLGMRRTMFVVPTELAPVVQAACTEEIAAKQRRLLVQQLEQTGVAADGGAWLGAVQEATMAALARRREAAAAELSADVPQLREQLRYPDGLQQGVCTRFLFVLAAEGRIFRGRPRGSWTSSQYRWSPAAVWLPDGLPEVERDVASAELVRRWLWAFGPAPVSDLKWWTGWTAGRVRQALAAVAPVDVALDDGTGVALADDLDPVPAPAPWAALLPALDPTPMGWSERRWFLGDHRPALFDRTGNIGPTVWWDGRIVGGWAQRGDGSVVHRLLDDVGADAAAAVEAAASRLQSWLGPARVRPRFRTPLERELLA